MKGQDSEKPLNLTPTEKNVCFFLPSYNFVIDSWIYRVIFSISCTGFYHFIPNVGYLALKPFFDRFTHYRFLRLTPLFQYSPWSETEHFI